MRRRYLIAFFVVITLTVGIWALPRFKREVAARNCLANMKSMGYGATVWAQENSNNAPTNWLCFSEQLVTPKMMLCPADSQAMPAQDWAAFGPENTSYEILGGGARWGESNRVFFRCTIHGHVCLSDGSVLRRTPPSK